MSEDQGTNDAASGAVPGSDAAVPAPAVPAALTDEALNKVAGGVDVYSVNAVGYKAAPTGPACSPGLK